MRRLHQRLQTKDMYANAKKAWMTSFLFKESLSFFFKMSISSGIFLSNPHILILDGHVSHVTLETIE
jgi:hypothetical protein